MSATRAWRTRQSRRMAWEAASSAALRTPRRRRPCRLAIRAAFEPITPGSAPPANRSAPQRGEVGHRLPEPMAGVLDVLLDLPLLPPGGWIAELGLKQEVADHR